MKYTVRNRFYYCVQKAYNQTGSLVGVTASDTISKSDFLAVLYCAKRGSMIISGCRRWTVVSVKSIQRDIDVSVQKLPNNRQAQKAI
jgi:hypothetical protein